MTKYNNIWPVELSLRKLWIPLARSMERITIERIAAINAAIIYF